MNKSLRTHLNVRSLYGSLFSCLIAVFLFASCQSYKKVPYLQDAGVVKDTNQQENLYDAKIMPKDLLTIVVSCTSPELAVPFNLTVATPANAATASTQLIVDRVLLPMMIFVHVDLQEQKEVLTLSSISRYMVLRGESTPAVIPDQQMLRFKFMLDYSDETISMSTSPLAPGEKIRVIKGPLAGLILNKTAHMIRQSSRACEKRIVLR